MEAAVTGDQWQAQAQGCRGDDAIGHVGNNVSRNAPQRASDVGIEWNDCERGSIPAEFSNKSVESIGGNAPAFPQVQNLNERDGGNVRWLAAGGCAVNQRKDFL